MKKWIWISLIAAALIALLAAGFGIYRHRQAQELERSLEEAEAVHETLNDRYKTALEAAQRSSLTVTEGDRLIGVYTLEDLGLAETAETAVEKAFDSSDRLSAEDFAALPQEEQLAQRERADFQPEPVALSLDTLDFSSVLSDLNTVPRQAPTDCKAEFTGSGFVLHEEIPGTKLDETRVLDALNGCMTDLHLTEEPLSLSCDIADCDPYVAPAVTLENQQYDLNEMLYTILHNRNYKLHVDLRGTEEVLDTDACKALLYVDSEGKVCMDRERAAAQIAQWAEAYDADRVPYCFSSYSAGKVLLPFLTVDCRLDQETLLDRMEEALCRLSYDTVDASFTSTDRSGRAVAFDGTYIEVDIARQTMTCFRDGALLVSTPIVSGRSWGHMTPSGYYRVQSKLPNQWLTGPDYCVFVQYWLGFYGSYGIHDARWRSIFGGEQYINNGSHGCVNTPTEAMELIYGCAEVNTPVLVFNIP